MGYTVAKFGGTSVADASQIKKVLDIVRSDQDRKLIVVSAPGKRFDDDTKVTDLLIQLGEECLANSPRKDAVAEKVVARFREIAADLEIHDNTVDEIQQKLYERMEGDHRDPDGFRDVLKASGEDFSARLIAAAIDKHVRPAQYISPLDAGLLLTDEAGQARVLDVAYERLKELHSSDKTIVFPGFFGYTPEGKLVTFSRGGSDITGSILAAAVGADLYENFTDVDYVCAADPRSVPNAAQVQELTFAEMRELAYAGFGVFHDEALIPVIRAQVPVRIKNTNKPDGEGTLICNERSSDKHPVAGIASSGHFVSVNLGQFLMNREVGYVRKLLTIIERHDISWEHMPSSIDTVSIIIRNLELKDGVLEKLLQDIREELNPESLTVMEDIAIIMVVGEGMDERVGVAAKATTALAEAKVNIELINQGSSEISIMFGVKAQDRDRAVAALHSAFFDQL